MKHGSLTRGSSLRALLARIALPVVATALATVSAAQVELGGEPASARAALRSQVPTHLLPRVDIEQLVLEDRLRGPNQPFRFGARLEVDLNLDNSGVWEDMDDGGRVWRLRLRSREARSLGLTFSRFQLPVDGELFVYNDDRTTVRGAYTFQNHKPNGRFAIQPTPGDALYLEYHEPAGSHGNAEIAISSVIHDYKGFNSFFGAGDCNVDVTCPVAAPFADQVDATVRIALGPFLCSGVLINNSAHDGTQYLLTADHCGDPTDAIFRFNFQRSTCGSGTGPTDQTVQGSVVLANDPAVDLTFIRVIPQIPASYNPYYAGWDRSGDTPFATFGVHHPSGDEKSISIDADSPNSPDTFWRVLEWDLGTTEVGSSGSALFDPQGRVIGTLFGGDANCGNPVNDFYTRFELVWDQVAPYLDPLDTGYVRLNGFDPDDVPPQPLNIANVTPPMIEILNPGTEQTVQLLGGGFNETTTVELNGTPVDSDSYSWINPGRLALDMPLVAGPGTYTLTVREGGDSSSMDVDVVPNALPTLQVGTGDPGNQVFINAPFTMAGQPGQMHFVTFSESPLPSFHPAWTLEYGNQFSELMYIGIFTIPASGYVQYDSPTAGTAGSTFYLSSTLVERGLPALVSNLQEVRVLF